MANVQFIFAIHNHQPVGNFEFVAEEAYRKSYLPFIQVLERHPSIKIVLHYTGPLYRFFEQRHPEFLKTLRKLVAKGRAEILSGGFYEPILAVLPDDDKIGQVRALSDYVRKNLGYRSAGMWLAERVWEPHLPKTISEAGIDHVVVDDFHFKMAGLPDEELGGYYLTEEQNCAISVFPGSEKLRYLIPFHRPEETIEYLSTFRSSDRTHLAVMADDGEKFGVWPETYKTVYEEGWLDRFFTLLEENSAWLQTTTFAEYRAKEPPVGRIYLPTASYMEMGEWTLPTPAMREFEHALTKVKTDSDCACFRPFMKGGIWRNFLAKYPESNHMHKRMLMASAKVKTASVKCGGAAASRMRDLVYQAQCNDAYWHGVFGGLYLPHLRSALYERLIEAEYLADAALRKRSGTASATWCATEQGDYNLDGRDEVMLNTNLLNAFVEPARGGRITEIDWKPRPFNLTNTLTRRHEVYHDKITVAAASAVAEAASDGPKTIHERVSMKEEGLADHLHYDRYCRGCLMDHFPGPGATLSSFMQSAYVEDGDFVTGEYGSTVRKSAASCSIALERIGIVAGRSVRVHKELSARRNSPELAMRYTIENRSSHALSTLFGSEFNFSLLAGDAYDRYYDIPGKTLDKRNLASSGEIDDVSCVSLVDEWLDLKLTLSFDKAATLWRAPIETVSQSEAGFERVYQSSMVMPVWKIDLGPRKSWQVEIRFSVANVKAAGKRSRED
jgi:hypothetical protein